MQTSALRTLLPYSTGYICTNSTYQPLLPLPFRDIARAFEAYEKFPSPWGADSPQRILDETVKPLPLLFGGRAPRVSSNKLTPSLVTGIASWLFGLRFLDIVLLLHPPSTPSPPRLLHAKQPWVGDPVYLHPLQSVNQLVTHFNNTMAALQSTMNQPNLAKGTDSPALFKIAIECNRVSKSRSALSIQRNLLMAALCLSIMVSESTWQLPVNFQSLQQTTQESRAQGHAELRKLLGSSNKVRQVLQIALAISPLVLLSDQDLDASAIDLEDLLLNMKRQGNQKPDWLVEFETEIWQAVFGVAQGEYGSYQALTNLHTYFFDQEVEIKDDDYFQTDSRVLYDPKTCTLYSAVLAAPAPEAWPLSPVAMAQSTLAGETRASPSQSESQDCMAPESRMPKTPPPQKLRSEAPETPEHPPFQSQASPSRSESQDCMAPESRMPKTPPPQKLRSEAPPEFQEPIRSPEPQGHVDSRAMSETPPLGSRAVSEMPPKSQSPMPRRSESPWHGSPEVPRLQSPPPRHSPIRSVSPLVAEYDIPWTPPPQEDTHLPSPAATPRRATDLQVPHFQTHPVGNVQHVSSVELSNGNEQEVEWVKSLRETTSDIEGTCAPFLPMEDTLVSSLNLRGLVNGVKVHAIADQNGELLEVLFDKTHVSDAWDPAYPWGFNEKTLAGFMSVSKPIEIEDESAGTWHYGTPKEMVANTLDKEEYRKALSSLPLPLPNFPDTGPPTLDIHALRQSAGSPGTVDHLNLSTVVLSTEGSSIRWRWEAGQGFKVTVWTGSQVWVLAIPKDPRMISAIGCWYDGKDKSLFNYEVIWLKAGHELTVHPATVYSVYTLTNSMYTIVPFYSGMDLHLATFGAVHNFFLSTSTPRQQARMNLIANWLYQTLALQQVSYNDRRYLPLLTKPKQFNDILLFICGIEAQNMVSLGSYENPTNSLLSAFLQQSGVLPHVAFRDFDLNNIDEEMRFANILSRGRVRHLLDFFFSNLTIVDKDGNIQDGRKFLFDPLFAWFLVALQHYTHHLCGVHTDFSRQLAWILASFPLVQLHYDTFIQTHPVQDDSSLTNMVWPDLPTYTLCWKFEPIPPAPALSTEDLLQKGMNRGDFLYLQFVSSLKGNPPMKRQASPSFEELLVHPCTTTIPMPKVDIETAKELFLEYASYELNISEFEVEKRYFTPHALPPSIDLTEVACILAATNNKMPGQRFVGWTVEMTHAFLASLEKALYQSGAYIWTKPDRKALKDYIDQLAPVLHS
ncbi:hypothetical protein BKA70DRAFT_1393732 [Coprinopsis sp. MPI-PUGE-AT-0042]|nr:hypothetical protein BKA70DRAFT_1393732 [Coprinopsis sp. MPI-PUGE-AT-0042]